jgi:hypothetical protein
MRQIFGIPEAKELSDEVEMEKFVPLQQQKEEELEKIRLQQEVEKRRQKAAKKRWF